MRCKKYPLLTIVTPGTAAALTCALLPAVAGGAPQSALHPAGTEAERIADLFWWMGGGAVVIWALVIGIAVYATQIRPAPHGRNAARWLIIGGGAVFPTLVLAGLLVYTLPLTPELRAPADAGLRIDVSGEQWWWRVRYLPEGGEAVELANEIRLPVGRRVRFILTSPDVIHSFWIPSLAGKVDMIPGRVTTLILEPTETGVFRGACAEYCGTSHALMNFMVEVMEPSAFEQWLAQQAAPAQRPTTPLAEQGLEAFLMNGCGACHTVRGTRAAGKLGPDLTHVGGRLSLGAGILPNEPKAFVRWIGHTEQVKPDVKMPAFGVLPQEQLTAIAVYLNGLQ